MTPRGWQVHKIVPGNVPSRWQTITPFVIVKVCNEAALLTQLNLNSGDHSHRDIQQAVLVSATVPSLLAAVCMGNGTGLNNR